ncbi:hypothetical protein DL240_02735 [Lujinxingia litoralis]|uniref:TonB C-terminal domain-containing protein n=1 Tax=Lujinxingia litoralis TaxID=2211119 RepID=A0A328C9K1_9DELT|nr:hypothetical protein [Lujinxingia litoralis]RAL25145.1 hypothetical protein DL240_02735 [Lujinxingia litoralis]
MLKRCVRILPLFSVLIACQDAPAPLNPASVSPVMRSVVSERDGVEDDNEEVSTPRPRHYDYLASGVSPAQLWEYRDAQVSATSDAPFTLRRIQGAHPGMHRFSEVVGERYGEGVVKVERADGQRADVHVLACPVREMGYSAEAFRENSEGILKCLEWEPRSPLEIGHLLVRIAFNEKGEAVGYANSPANLSVQTERCIGHEVARVRLPQREELCRMIELGGIF